jgi:NADPH:quinone reductase-like Zn-dependent oxidoreductase
MRDRRRAGKRQFRLGRMQTGCNPCVVRVVVAGTIAAYVKSWLGYDNNDCEVIVRRLTDGKRIAAYSAVGGAEFQAVSSLVARPDGHVAWIGVGQGFSPGTAVQSDGAILDHGFAIRPHSLKLHGTLLSWKHGSKSRHASLR